MLSKDRKGLSYDKRKEKETAAKEAFRKKGTCEEAGSKSAGRVAVSVRGNVEYWEEAEVLEVELPEAGSVDFEDLEGTLGDEESDAWLQEQQIHTVFAVTIRPDDYELAKKVMEHIVSLVDGYFCADNENLQPRIPAKEAEQTTVES